jgi:hypothetical protein
MCWEWLTCPSRRLASAGFEGVGSASTIFVVVRIINFPSVASTVVQTAGPGFGGPAAVTVLPLTVRATPKVIL